MLFLGVTSLLISSCDKKDKLKIGEVTHSVFYAPQYLAVSEKIFEKYGLNVEISLLSGADKVMASLLSKDIDIGLMGPEASIYVYAQGRTDYAITFAQLTQRDGTFIVGREKNDNFTLNDLKGKEILGGRKGGMPLMTLEYALKKNGLTINDSSKNDSVNVRTDIAFAAMIGSFVNGEADYTTAFEPNASELELNGSGFVMASVGLYTDEVAYTCYQSLKSYMNKNEKTINDFTSAIAEAISRVYMMDSLEIAESIHPFFKETKVEILAKSIQRYKEIKAWSSTPYLDKYEFTHLQDIMIMANELDKYMPYDLLVDNSYVISKR